MHFKYLWKSPTYYPGSSEGLQQLPKQSPCISAGHFQSVLQTKAIILFSKCKFAHIIPLLYNPSVVLHYPSDTGSAALGMTPSPCLLLSAIPCPLQSMTLPC